MTQNSGERSPTQTIFFVVDEAGGVAAVLLAVGGVDLVAGAGVDFLHEGDVLLDAAGADTGLVRCLGGAEPAAAGRAPTMTIDACISSRRLDGLSVVVRVAPGVRNDPDRVAAEDPPSGRRLFREGNHAEARLQTMPAMHYSTRSIVTLKSSLWRSITSISPSNSPIRTIPFQNPTSP